MSGDGPKPQASRTRFRTGSNCFSRPPTESTIRGDESWFLIYPKLGSFRADEWCGQEALTLVRGSGPKRRAQLTWFRPETDARQRWKHQAIWPCADPGVPSGSLRTPPTRPALALHKTLHFSLFLTHTQPVTDLLLISDPPAVTLDNLVLTHRIRGEPP